MFAERPKRHIYTLCFQERNPIEETEISLRNIETGVSADIGVNIDDAKTIGAASIDIVIGQNINKYSFKKSQQAVVFNINTFAKVTHDVISIDPQLLFQHLTTVAGRYLDNIAEIFQYELWRVLSALFDSSGLPREVQHC